LRIHALGDAALVVQLGSVVDRKLGARAQSLARRLRRLTGVEEALASYGSVTVHFDPDRASFKSLSDAVERLGRLPVTTGRPGSLHRISVVYDGQDLEDVAQVLGLPIPQLIAAHAAPIYSVFLIGFAPGLPYLGPLPARLWLPRRSVPRTRVPAGSVAIAGRQTTVYTWPTPGGWHVLGRTAARLVIPERDPPALLQTGDWVRFVPITE
jgi:KipI family sensor histidine kinase inhibitor